MSRFTNRLGLQLLEDDAGRAILNRAGRCQWAGLAPPLVYAVGAEDSGEEIVFGPGCVTDLASIPPIVAPLLPPDGPWVKPAAIHDLLYRTCGTGMVDGVRHITRARPYTRAEADKILLEAMKVVGVPKWKRGLIYAAVDLFGGAAWGR